MRNATCSLCPLPVRTRGWCFKHYDRWLRHGDPLYEDGRREHSPRPYRLDKPEGCDIADCDRPHYCNGLCSAHWTRRQRYGDPLAGPPMRKRRGTGPPRDQARHSPAYVSRHRAIRKARGSAWRLRCQHCGDQADDWATIHGRAGDQPDDYMPLCKSCHNRYDGKVRNLPRLVGEDHPMAKLTNQQVREIWARRNTGESRSGLAREYGTTYATVWAIHAGRSWAGVIGK